MYTDNCINNPDHVEGGAETRRAARGKVVGGLRRRACWAPEGPAAGQGVFVPSTAVGRFQGT